MPKQRISRRAAMGRCASVLAGLPLSSKIQGFEGATKRFKIAVVGDGVTTTNPPPPSRFYSLNASIGKAIWDAALVAHNESEQGFQGMVDLDGWDDGGSEEQAAAIAHILRRDPAILAVVGHTTSGCTQAAGSILAEAGIPLLMPVATGPYVFYPPGKETAPKAASFRTKNAFRLPPADVSFQAPAIASLVDRLGKTQPFLIADLSAGEEKYSEPLYTMCDRYLGDIVVDRRRVNREVESFDRIARSIRNHGCDVVVFCGYGVTAIDLLDALRSEYYEKVDPSKRPIIVLSDGCKGGVTLDPSGFQVYLTFPAKPIKEYAFNSSTGFKELLKSIDKKRVDDKTFQETYEVFAYDAIYILEQMFSACGPANISRHCILEQMTQQNASFLGSAVGRYVFNNNENVASPYEVWVADGTKTNKSAAFTFDREISNMDIQAFKASHRINK